MTMEDFDEMIFDDDEFLDDVQEPQNQSISEEHEEHIEHSEQINEEDDLTSEVLRLKGISNPEKIKFEDESGAIIERSWNTLSKEEQLNILMGNESEESDLNEDEIELLNSIRKSGLSVNDYISSLQPKQEVVKTYNIDSLSDDEVYALDLLEKVGADNITDEELSEAVANAKKNEALFKKTVEGLRNEYIRLEKDQEMRQANEEAAKQQEAYNKFATSIMGEIRGLNSFAGQDLELSTEDVEELSAFMLDIDDNGMSAFGKAMQDPALFTKAAFWLLNEDKIIEELTKQMQDTYTRGYENAKKDLQGKSKLVFNKTKSQSTTKPATDFFVDDDDW